MTQLNTRQPNFPENPSDGFQIKEDLPDGSGYVMWTYNAFYNEWTNKVFKAALTGYLYTDQVRTLPTEVTTFDGNKDYLTTQQQVNNFIGELSQRGLKATSRAADQVDFLQNSVGKGVWSRMEGILGPDEYPRAAQFWADATAFNEITKFKINDTGVGGPTNPGSLQDTRVGDYLTVQCNYTNDFGQYVIVGMATENADDNIIRTFEVKLYQNSRSLGDLGPLAACTITTFRPSAVIVSDEQPVVSSRGVLWYREADDHLFISNYPDGFTGEGAQWTDLTAGGGGEVSGDYLPLTGGTLTGALQVKRDSGTSLIVRKGDSIKFDVQAGGKIRCFYDLALDDDDTTVVTRGFVKEQLASVGGLSLRDKMYLQGFYPWRFGEGTQVNNPGEWLAKTSDYNVVLEPASWKILYFSTIDAYGQDLAGKFLNHMDMNKLRELQLWFAREDGTKLCSYTSKGRCRDQNFENWFTVDMDASDKELVVSPNYDTASLEITRGEVIWIKCSTWGN